MAWRPPLTPEPLRPLRTETKGQAELPCPVARYPLHGAGLPHGKESRSGSVGKAGAEAYISSRGTV
jgi:hypothetical protein